MPEARLVECDGAGHMVIFEARDQVNAGARGPRGGCLDMNDDTTIETVDGSRAADVLAVVHEAFAEPARRSTRRRPRSRRPSSRSARRSTRTAGCSSSTTARRSGRCCSSRRGRLLGLRRVGVLAPVRGLGVAAQMASPGPRDRPGARLHRHRARGARGAAGDDQLLAQPRVRRVRPQRQPPDHAADAPDHASRCGPPRTPARSASTSADAARARRPGDPHRRPRAPARPRSRRGSARVSAYAATSPRRPS